MKTLSCTKFGVWGGEMEISPHPTNLTAMINEDHRVTERLV